MIIMFGMHKETEKEKKEKELRNRILEMCQNKKPYDPAVIDEFLTLFKDITIRWLN